MRTDPDTPKDTKSVLENFLMSAISAKPPFVLNLLEEIESDDEQGLHTVYRSLVAAAKQDRGHRSSTTLTNRIRFPYSRHSSYGEVCHLVSALRPMDIWPCTVDTMRWIRQGMGTHHWFSVV